MSIVRFSRYIAAATLLSGGFTIAAVNANEICTPLKPELMDRSCLGLGNSEWSLEDTSRSSDYDHLTPLESPFIAEDDSRHFGDDGYNYPGQAKPYTLLRPELRPDVGSVFRHG